MELDSVSGRRRLVVSKADPGVQYYKLWRKLVARTKKTYPTLVSAGGIITNVAGEVLFCHPTGSRWDNWRVPKGLVEEGEDLKKAALREVLEETGYECEILAELETSVVYRSSQKGKTVNKELKMFLMRAGEQVRKPDWENDKFKWVPAAEAHKVAAEREWPLIEEALRKMKV